MSKYNTPIQDYDETTDTATYNADDAEYLVDTGIYIECPDCGKQVVLDRAISDGCAFGCEREAWSVLFDA